MAVSFENSQLIHISSKIYDSTCILLQTLLSIEKYILISIFAKISYNPYLGPNRLFNHNSWISKISHFFALISCTHFVMKYLSTMKVILGLLRL